MIVDDVMHLRTLTVPALALVSVVALTQPAARATDGDPGYRVHDYADGQAMSILPPGQNGLVNLTDLLSFETTKKRPANSDDQLVKYRDLIYGADGLSDADLSTYFDDESFGVRPTDVQRTETPGPGVTVYRDGHDVPHIYGTTDAAAAYGAGFAQAEDRLFLMDVLRHYGSGTLASFLGSSCEFEQMDHDQLLLAPYTKQRAQDQVDALDQQGPYGRLAKTMVESYVAGVNAYIAKSRTDPRLLPADYVASIGVPQKWSATDVVAIASLIGGIFGKGGGSEADNAELLQYLRGEYGAADGSAAYKQLNHPDDPLAPTTTDKRFDYDSPTKPVDTSLTALPDQGAQLTGGPVATTPDCQASSGSGAGGLTPKASEQQRTTALVTGIVSSLKAMPKHMSNALVVDGDKTASGHPVAVFGPQVSYFAPQILSLEEIQSPHVSAAGASFPGTGLVELGRGQDYAWSATSSSSDIVDQRVEKVCNPAGGAAEPEGKAYLFDGVCTPMVHETYAETAVPKPGGAGAPARLSHEVYRTRHGVVQGWTTVQGQPVAIVNQRSTYEHDIDSGVGFLQFGDPHFTKDVTSWQKAASNIGFTFNWFYADDRDTGYVASGRLPRRNPAAETSLPTWGTGRAEWRGQLSAAEHVHDTDPAKGYFISWNNKPAPGQASDNAYPYGQTFRSQLLVGQLDKELAAGKVTRADVVQAMAHAATQDLDGVTVVKELLVYAGGRHSAGVAAMLSQLRPWVASGAHRIKTSPGDTQYASASAVAIADELVPHLVRALYDRALGGRGESGVGSNGGATTAGYAVLPMQWTNTPNSGGAHLGSAYDGGYEGYLLTTLQQLQGKRPADGFSGKLQADLCTGGPSTCRAAVEKALEKTYADLVTANGSSDVASWTASTQSRAADQTMPEYDAIAFRALGIVGQPTIDWQNRPTFQQVVEFPRHRAR